MRKKLITAKQYSDLTSVKRPKLYSEVNPLTSEEFLQSIMVADLDRGDRAWYYNYPTEVDVSDRKICIDLQKMDFMHKFKIILSSNEFHAFHDFLSEQIVSTAIQGQPQKSVEYYFKQWVKKDRYRYYEDSDNE